MKPYMDSPQYDESRNRFEHSAGYRNDKGLFDVLGLAGAFLTRDSDPAEQNGMPLLDPLQSPPAGGDGHDVTWIGHASLLFRRNGVSVLTDPVFSDRASPFPFSGPKRVVAPAYTAESLPKVDILVVSHAHYDHLDLPGLKRLAAVQPEIRVVVPLGLARYLRRAGFTDVTEIDWWQESARDGTVITATPVRHWASRSPFDRNKTLWAGFMFRFEDGYQFYFAGDTGYSADFTETPERLGAPDFAAIPIGAYEPRDFMRESHCNPEEAVQIFVDLDAGLAVGVHWGTFKLTLEPLAQPPQLLRAALEAAGIPANRFRALTHGERWDL
ncbi:MAG: MBL fold metallo-hydrolase [Pseudomonadota bacterium]|nr:MBL fold metallo-hydrolase [Pseudomonadota bacterium]